MSMLRNGHVTMSILRNGHLKMSLMAMLNVDFNKQSCHHVDFKERTMSQCQFSFGGSYIVACGTVQAKMGLTGSAPRGNDAVQSVDTVWVVKQT